MSGGGAPVSLLLNYNSLAEAAVEYFGECCKNGLTKKQVLMQLQSVCATYACQGVKRNGGLTDSKKKLQAATNAYKEIVVPGFLAWLTEVEGNPVQLPRWVNQRIMGCSTVSGEGKDEPKYYTDVNKVWTKHMNDYLLIRRDINPAYDRVTAGQPEGQPPSGHQYPDQLSDLLDELWILQCKQSGKTRDAVDVEKEAEFLGTGPSQSASPATVQLEDGGSRATVHPVSGETSTTEVGATSAGAVEAGLGGGAAQSGGGVESGAEGGGAALAASGGDLGPEPAIGSPEYPQWLARQAAINNKAADTTAPDGGSSPSDAARKSYPERPSSWMHPLTLTFCFFGRPAGSDEDTELATCISSSGPSSRGVRKKGRRGSATRSEGGSSGGGSIGGGSSGGGASDEGSTPDNPLNVGAVRQFVGAGEAQSRAKVKKATAEVQLQESRDTTRKQFLQQAAEQTHYSKQMLVAVERVAENTSAQRELDEEEACRKRKNQLIDELKVDLDICEPWEQASIKAKIRATNKKPVNVFTASFVAGGMDNVLGPSAPGAPSVGPGLPGFSHNNGTPGPAGGGAAAQSGVAADSGGVSMVTRI